MKRFGFVVSTMLLSHRLRAEIPISKSHLLSLDLSDALVVLVSYYFEPTLHGIGSSEERLST